MSFNRPHIMTWIPMGPAGEDSDGYAVEGTPGTPIQVPCRFYSGGGRSGIKEFKNEDNIVVKQTGFIRVDKGSVMPPIGQQVVVSEGDYIHFSGAIRDQYRGQLISWRCDV